MDDEVLGLDGLVDPGRIARECGARGDHHAQRDNESSHARLR
jgi:hypothetical protein